MFYFIVELLCFSWTYFGGTLGAFHQVPTVLKHLSYIKFTESQNDTKSCCWHGGVRRLRLEAGGGAGPKRPLPGVPCLLPGGHPASDGCAERSPLIFTTIIYIF